MNEMKPNIFFFYKRKLANHLLSKVDLIKVRAAMWKGREALAANVNC